MSDEKLHRFYQSQQSTVRKVLFEHTPYDGMMRGFTENYVKVEASYDKQLVNKISIVNLGSFNEGQTALSTNLHEVIG